MATFKPEGKSVCLETGSLLLLIFMNFILGGTCQDISLLCPSVQESSITKFICTVPTSVCSTYSLFFDFESKDEAPSTICQTSSDICDQQPVGEMNCSCVRSNSELKEYQLNFRRDKTKYGERNLTCNVNTCLPVPKKAVCQIPSYALPSTSSSTTTVGSASSGNNMHALRTGIVTMSVIIALISTHLR